MPVERNLHGYCNFWLQSTNRACLVRVSVITGTPLLLYELIERKFSRGLKFGATVGWLQSED